MLEIGWASQDMTPVRPAMIQGQKHRRVGSQAMDPLMVTAMALRDPRSDDCVVMISCDLVAISRSMLDSVRSQLSAQLPDLPADKVVMNGTHTHTSLVTEEGSYTHPGDGVMTPSECETWVVKHAVQAGVEAWQSRRPGQIGRAFGHAVVGHNRYAAYTGGQAQMYGATNREDFTGISGYEDHSLDMLFTWLPEGNLSGVALAIPCPAQVDEGLTVFSADFWHEIRLDLRQRLGQDLQVLPLCAAAGDQSPHFLLYRREEAEMRERHGLTERQEIAVRVGMAVERALQSIRPEIDPVSFRHQTVKAELTPVSIDRQQCDWALSELERCQDNTDPDSWWPRRLQQVVDCFNGVEPLSSMPVELHFIRLGDAVIATNPFELFIDYSHRIKARSPAAQTIVVQLAGHGFYLPTERALKAGGYGANPVVCPVGHQGGGELVNTTLRAIAKLFD
ncbi:MAG: hypothetical protein QGH37_04875 [Candidatus Poribacteria bacterium]|jgi:hypothetical protein|nr:hypothetical protein [Candidatus Poribacteria bacterium]MDP6961429.1 hypothetical protein [Dehalococcoidia bacterium]